MQSLTYFQPLADRFREEENQEALEIVMHDLIRVLKELDITQMQKYAILNQIESEISE